MTTEEIRAKYQKETGNYPVHGEYYSSRYSIWLEENLLNWLKLGHTPEKWKEVYTHYQELLTKEDTASWWQEQFEIADKERNELKEKLINNQ